MTPLFLTAIFVLVTLSVPMQVLWSPRFAFETGLISDEPPPCRPETEFETYSRYQTEANGSSANDSRGGSPDMGKGWRFSRRGQYICKRNIFSSRERNSYYNFLLNHSQPLVADMVRRAIKSLKDYPNSSQLLWTVRVRESVPAPLQTYLLTAIQTNLTESLGPGRVLRGTSGATSRVIGKSPDQLEVGTPYVVLTFGARQVVDLELLFEADLRLVTQRATQTWQL